LKGIFDALFLFLRVDQQQLDDVVRQDLMQLLSKELR